MFKNCLLLIRKINECKLGIAHFAASLVASYLGGGHVPLYKLFTIMQYYEGLTGCLQLWKTWKTQGILNLLREFL